MNDSPALERRYRRLLVWFPAEHRREYAEEMISVLLASTPEGRRRPRQVHPSPRPDAERQTNRYPE